MDAGTLIALIGVMVVSVALALPGLLAFARNQRVDDSEAALKREQAQKVRQEREEITDRRLDATQAELDEVRRVLNSVQSEMNELRRGLAILLAQLERLGHTPDWTPPRASGVSKVGLRKDLRDGFNLEEMRDLAQDLGAPDGEIRGDTVTVYARELVAWAERRGLLGDLERRIQELRP